MPDKTIVINEWAKGVADSPEQGIAMLKNVNIEAFPGAVKSSYKPTPLIPIITTNLTFTADAPSDVCTASGSIQNSSFLGFTFVTLAVTFTTTGTLPAGLSTGTTYFLIYVSDTTFKVATTWANALAGTAIDITGAGTGVHTIVQVTPGTVNWGVTDPRTSYIYILDSNARVWTNALGVDGHMFGLLTGNTLTQGFGNGLTIFATSDASATYLFVFRGTNIDVINVFGDTQIRNPSWTNGWKSMNTGSGSNIDHYTLVGQDNIIYFTDSRYVGSIQEKAGQVFDPANSATYTYNNQALALPQNELSKCLEELGVNLLVGGLNFNKIYPWDRSSVSYTLPILVPEIGIYRLVNMGNTVYIFAGQKGYIYVTQGSYVKYFKKVPEYLTNINDAVSNNPISWGDARVKINSILFGIGINGSGVGNPGLYQLYADGRLIQNNTPAGGAQNVISIVPNGNFYFMGYAGNIDGLGINGATRYSNYECVEQSELYRVGDKTSKAKFSQIEIQVANTVNGDHIRAKYRTNKTSSFADFPAGAASFTADGTLTSFNADIGLTDIENIQIQIEHDGNTEIMEVRLFP